MSFFSSFNRHRNYGGSVHGTSSTGGAGSSRYAHVKSSGYGTSSAGSSGYGSGSGYGSTPTSSYGGSSTGYGRSQSYGSYNSTPNYSTPYSTSTYNVSSNASPYSSASGYSSAYSRPSKRDSSTSSLSSGGSNGSGYLKRASSRDRSSERSSIDHSIYGVKSNPRRKNDTLLSGVRKSSSYAGLHWMRTPEPDNRSREIIGTSAGDIIGARHQRSGSNSSAASDTVFEENCHSGVLRPRGGSRRDKSRDLEAILGREDHMLVQRLFEENKDILDAAHAQLTRQEEILVQKIAEASLRGRGLDDFQVWNIIQSH